MDERTAEIYSKFRNENWEKMDLSKRLEALQELENLSASLNHSAPRNVTAKELEGASYGYYDGNGIVVNKHILEKGIMVANVKDENTGKIEQMTHPVPDANIQMMDTIFHEDYHSFQEQAVNGEIPMETLKAMGITEKTLHNWQSNNSVLNYVDPEVDGVLYRIQGLEQSAFASGEKHTLEAFGFLNAKYGEDPNFREYITGISQNSYACNLSMAQKIYGDTNIQNTLQGKMNERYYMENVQYTNKFSAQKVESVLDKSMLEALKPNKTETDAGEKGALGHSNHGGFGGSGLSGGAGSSTGAFSGSHSGTGSSMGTFSGGLE